ncbi:MAG: hypothetical protein ABIH46_06810 [Chloroflexota bacterium]
MAIPMYEVVWPLGKSAYESIPPAEPAKDLRGKTICELWEWLFRGDEIFPILRELLSERFPGVKFVDYTKFGDTHGTKQRELIASRPRLLQEHGCDSVVSGVGA